MRKRQLNVANDDMYELSHLDNQVSYPTFMVVIMHSIAVSMYVGVGRSTTYSYRVLWLCNGLQRFCPLHT